MELTLETKVYSPAVTNRPEWANQPEWTGTLEAVFFPWGPDESESLQLRRFNNLMKAREFDTEEYGFEAGLALLTEADLPYIFNNPHARLAE